MTQAPPQKFPIVILCVLTGFLGTFQVIPNGLAVTLIAVAVFVGLSRSLDQGVPIEYMSSMLAVLQWLVGPYLAYQWGIEEIRYRMYVEAAEYFSFALPGTSAFVVGVLTVSGQANETRLLCLRDRSKDFQIGTILLLVSVGANVGAPYAPGGLTFFFHMASQLRYIAAIYFLFSLHPLRWLMIVLSLAQLLIRTADQAMFHDLLLWSALIACFWYLLQPRSFATKVGFIVAGMMFAVSIQAIKRDYRDAVQGGQNPSLFATAYELLIERKVLTSHSTIESAIIRLNQGWIISAVLRHVPSREPFAEGETIRDALEASLLPRFLAPDKKKAGGQENFRRFTGLRLQEETSMGISPLGEAYANYGRIGGTGFMLIWGLGFGLFLGALRHFSQHNPGILIWTPLIFYQAIKAETEVVVVLNQLVKGTVIAFACYGFIHHVYLKNAGLLFPSDHEPEPDTPGKGLADIQRH